MSNQVQKRVTDILLTIGIPAHIWGYHFLRHGIVLAIQTPDITDAITKRLYPAIAQQFNSTPSRVERSIRHAIEVCWARGKLENLNEIFGVNIYDKNDRPTNRELVSLIADKLLIEDTVL